jgi:glycosyltransferase involved in cell wall biosynthesis
VAKDLVLLTSHYPFGRAREAFLDDEIRILARRFDRVRVVPSHRDTTLRKMPDGVLCDTTLADIQPGDVRAEFVRRPLRPLWQLGRALVDETRPRTYVRHGRWHLSFLTLHRLKYERLRSMIAAHGLHDAVFYDYWLTNSTLALAGLRRDGLVRRAVARAHGGDLYDERSTFGAIPFRASIMSSLDRVFAISEHGRRYLADAHPGAAGRIVLSRLGVAAPGAPAARSRGEGPPLVVSCSAMTAVKRVDRIPAILGRVGTDVRWAHLGDGPERAVVEQAIRGSPASVSCTLYGERDHADVLRFLQENAVDLFLSVSSSEGLPVSMMEAISNGIPLLATAVGGVPEIVTGQTGRLVAPDAAPDVVAAAARAMLSGDVPSRAEVRAFFDEHFDAELNFNAFADMLHAL